MMSDHKTMSVTARLESLLKYYLDNEQNQDRIEKDIDEKMRTFTSPDSVNKLKPSPLYEAEEDGAKEQKASFSTSKEIVPTRIASINEPAANQPSKKKLSGDKLKSHEVFSYIKYDDISFASCSSPSGRYSEFALVIWLKQAGTYSQKFRIVINIMHDSKEQLWCISSSLIKRLSYSSKDEVESSTPNRACSQTELLKELKKTLIYAGLPPRSIHKRFLKMLRKGETITNISKYGFITMESSNHSVLQKKLEESSTATGYVGSHYYGHDFSHDYRRQN